LFTGDHFSPDLAQLGVFSRFGDTEDAFLHDQLLFGVRDHYPVLGD
jgi:hypothetical protein